MLVKEAINIAKNGNEDAFEWLIEYYESIFKKYVRKYHGDKVAEETIGSLENIIRDYFVCNSNSSMSTYLYNKAKFYGKKKKDVTIESKVSTKDKEKFEKVVEYYSDSFYLKISKFNQVLSDEELKCFSHKFIRNLCEKSSNSKANFRVSINSKIRRKVAYYKENPERLIKHYIEIIGITDNILNYYCNKCKTQIESGELYIIYKYLITFECEKIVMDSLLEYKLEKTNINEAIRSNFNKAYKNCKNKIQLLVTEIRQGKSDDVNKVKLFYVYIKDIIFKNYKDKTNLSDEELKAIIDEKYDKYMDSFLTNEPKTDIPKVLYACFSSYFNSPRFRTISLEEQQKIQDYYYEYFYYIDKYLKKLDTNYPVILARSELTNIYGEVIKKFYLKGSLNYLKTNIQRHMKDKITYLNDKYQDINIWNMAIHYKEQLINSSLIDERYASNIIYNLTLYYLSQRVNNTESFESYIINAVRSICNGKQEYKVGYGSLPVSVLNYKKIK